jgi:ubiquinone/menaquinone biosynthesis C-methylase UbiE
MDREQLKSIVAHYWNDSSCGTEFIKQPKHSTAYFKDIEDFRYKIEPEIFAFAQFTRFHGKKVLEVGIGAGTDFVQWVRAGAHAYGIDLTQEAIDNTQRRLAHENLRAYDIQVSDAEFIPYPDAMFDLVYSWGVINYSPDTKRCLQEIIRVTKPGGTIKIMVYNRYSLLAFYRYLLCGLFKGKPFQSLSLILYNHQESKGTKAFTKKEIYTMLADLPVSVIQLQANVTQHDLLYYKGKIARALAYMAACIGGWHRVGWFMTIELKKNI